MNETFNIQTLIEKLSKLNNSQQSIETLSSWCIYHRKKAKQIVETWDQVFSNTPKEQKVPFLYLANDILQNSRRKGSEFVNEFWKVLPSCLKNVYDSGEGYGKKVVNRLVEIWDERKVFGSRGRGLKDEILGDAPSPLLDNGKGSNPLDIGKSSNPIRVVRKDAYSVRIKLAVGGMPEKVVTAYQSVLDEHFNEDTALNKSNDAIDVLEKMQKDVDDAAEGKQEEMPLMSNLQEQETVLSQCIQQLESIKATRLLLVAQLKEALKEQETKLEHIHSQLQVARSQIQNANQMKQKLGLATATNGVSLSSTPLVMNLASEAPAVSEFSQLTKPIIPPLQPLQPVTNFASTFGSAEEEHKKAAAAVAAKLAASSSSAEVLSSILSSLAAEEAASKNSLSSGLISGSPPIFPMEKRPRLEKPMPMSETNNASYFGQAQQQPQQRSIPLTVPQVPAVQAPAATAQTLSQSNQAPSPFTPPPPPLPPLPPPKQFVQTSGFPMGMAPFGFMGNILPPPPPLPLHVSLGSTRPGIAPQPPPPPPPVQAQQQQPQQQTQQLQSTTTGHYQPPIGFFGQLQTSPPVQRP